MKALQLALSAAEDYPVLHHNTALDLKDDASEHADLLKIFQQLCVERAKGCRSCPEYGQDSFYG